MECEITFDAPVWKQISSEGKDLTMKMIEKDPNLRISAKDALNHTWFMIEHLDKNSLSLMQENVSKYAGYFDVETIKPKFGQIKFVPLLNLQDSETNAMSMISLFSPTNNVRSKYGSNASSEVEIDDWINKLNKSKNNGSFGEIKLVPIQCNNEDENLEESDISERGYESPNGSCTSDTRLFIAKGIRSVTKSPVMKKSHFELSPKITAINYFKLEENICSKELFGEGPAIRPYKKFSCNVIRCSDNTDNVKEDYKNEEGFTRT